MNDIFISYAAEERLRIKPFVDALVQLGFSVWWDRAILPGSKWEKVIEAELEQARCVIVFWSAKSILSDFVRAEADEARRRGILVPILIDDVNIPLGFRGIQAAKLVQSPSTLPNAEFNKLVEAVSAVLGRARAIEPAQVPTFALRRRRRILAGTLLAASISGTALYVAVIHQSKKQEERVPPTQAGAAPMPAATSEMDLIPSSTGGL